jgi:hypothetical protein
MRFLDVCLTVIMVSGITFFAICLFFYVKGKIVKESGKEIIKLGKFELKSSAFIFLVLISALFAVSPLINAYMAGSPPVVSAGKIDYIMYEVSGKAKDKMGKERKGITITAEQFRKGQRITEQKDSTDQMGSYSFTFDSVKLDDQILVMWDDPDGDLNTRKFSPKKAVFEIALQNK